MIRPAQPKDAPHIAKVFVETWRATYTGIVPQKFLDDLDINKSCKHWSDSIIESLIKTSRIHILVVEEDGQVVGYSSGGQSRDSDVPIDGEVFTIYLLPSHQKKNLGRQLFEVSLKSLNENGFKNAIVWALKDNSCHTFYEYLGGKNIKEDYHKIAGKSLKEVCYYFEL